MKIRSEIKKLNKRIEDLDETVAYLMNKIEKLENKSKDYDYDEIKNYIRHTIWESLREYTNSKHLEIVTLLNDEKITTKTIGNKVKELKDAEYDLEFALKSIKETLEKYKERN